MILRVFRTRITKATYLTSSVDDREVVLIDDVINTGRTIKTALGALHY
tara:strand:- start:413 stop:556 length:144 start_codon:yes stop_codon:yes gene_type:complete